VVQRSGDLSQRFEKFLLQCHRFSPEGQGSE